MIDLDKIKISKKKRIESARLFERVARSLRSGKSAREIANMMAELARSFGQTPEDYENTSSFGASIIAEVMRNPLRRVK